MKRILLILSVLVAGTVLGQNVPQGINYQAVARNNNGSLLANTTLTGVRFSILSSVSPDVVQYQEVHNNVPTNQFGLFTRVIGQGTQTGGLAANFAAIPWGASQCYIKIEVDQSGWIDMGTLPFWAVPYAFVAGNVVNGGVGPTGPQGANGANGINGATGPTGPQGIQGPQGPAGSAGATGPQGPAGANGANGADGATGPQGPAGANGATGAQGPAGADGATGPAGAQGPAGANGATGAQGPAGADGATGPQGPTGFLQNGDSAGDTPYWDGSAWVTTNDNIYNNGGNVGIGNSSPATKLEVGGVLTLDATDQQEGGEIDFNQGSLAGPGQFVMDNFYSFSGGNKLRMFHTLGATNNFVMMQNGNIGIGGFQWFDQPSSPLHVKGTLRVEDGTQQAGYIFTSDASGNGSWQAPSGLQGPTGPQGPAGAVGATGPAGANGATGPAGANGATGPQGPAGADGATGAQGPAGATGPQGPAGANGATGAQGPAGATGPQGPAGANGATGAQGPAGANGATGAQGPQGPAGANGATGAQGPAGANGATGAQGPQGPAGANGATGPQGPTGPSSASNSNGVNNFGPGFVPGSAGAWLNVASVTLTSTGNNVFYEANGATFSFADFAGYRVIVDGATNLGGGLHDNYNISFAQNQWLWSIGARAAVAPGAHTYTLQMYVSDSPASCQIVEYYFSVRE